MTATAPVFKFYQQRVEQQLTAAFGCLWKPAHPKLEPLHQALVYAVLNGGKRIRPILLYCTGQALGVPLAHLDAAACAVELIHSYSLVHDDLPAMDNDDLRRGKPTCHKAFGEATAILTGDALQAMAFEILSDADWNPVPAETRLKQVQRLSKAAGPAGMVGGQLLDLEAEGNAHTPLTELIHIHRHKTGALICASIELAVEAAQCEDPHIREALHCFADALGLAFQVKDDLLDIEGTTETLGKPMHSDITQDKITFPRLLGVSGTRKKLDDLLLIMQTALLDFEPLKTGLTPIAEFCVNRDS